MYRLVKGISSIGEAIARFFRFSFKELLVQRKVAVTARREGAEVPRPETMDETDEEREEREDKVETSDTIESGEDADEEEEVDRAKEDRRPTTG